MRALPNRVANEPAVVVGLVLAIGNLIGQDFSGDEAFIESAVVFLASIFVRQQVTPVRKSNAQ